MPTSAQTIQDGKYEPRMFLDGAPSQPTSSADKQIHHMSLGTFICPSFVA